MVAERVGVRGLLRVFGIVDAGLFDQARGAHRRIDDRVIEAVLIEQGLDAPVLDIDAADFRVRQVLDEIPV